MTNAKRRNARFYIMLLFCIFRGHSNRTYVYVTYANEQKIICIILSLSCAVCLRLFVQLFVRDVYRKYKEKKIWIITSSFNETRTMDTMSITLMEKISIFFLFAYILYLHTKYYFIWIHHFLHSYRQREQVFALLMYINDG